MALVRLSAGEHGTIRPGDAVFDTREHEHGFPVHVGIYVGDRQAVDASTVLEVQGSPRKPGKGSMNVAFWNTPGNYSPDEIGQRRDVDEVAVLGVRMLANAMLVEIGQIGSCIRWETRRRIDATRTTRDGIPLFLEGTCSQFVEYIYEAAGLDLVDEQVTAHPGNEGQPRDAWRLFPTTQVHAFWVGAYPLRVPWDDRLARWDDCLFGARSNAR